jgi:hypothetical protein
MVKGWGVALGSLLPAFAACTPYERMPPAYFAQTANVLEYGEADASGVGGGGVDPGGNAAGASARVRVGIGGHQEVGVEGSRLSLGQQNASDAHTVSFSGRLSWKYAPSRQAIIMGAGLTST